MLPYIWVLSFYLFPFANLIDSEKTIGVLIRSREASVNQDTIQLP